MIDAEAKQCLLTLIVAPSVENALADWLLEREDIRGFTSMPVSGHGASIHSMTAAEQVAGRRGQVMFHLHLSGTAARTLLEDCRRAFEGSGIHYWLVPLIEAGHLD